VTGLNGHSQGKSSGSTGRGKGYKSERVRHGQERKLEFDIQKRRGNNQYLVHEQSRRRERSGLQEQRLLVSSQDPEEPVEEQGLPRGERTDHVFIREHVRTLFNGED
jgi:hypothetical protein